MQQLLREPDIVGKETRVEKCWGMANSNSMKFARGVAFSENSCHPAIILCAQGLGILFILMDESENLFHEEVYASRDY